jgi:hypothetical protein
MSLGESSSAEFERGTPQGVLLTGEGVSFLTAPERLAVVREVAGKLGLEVTVIRDLQSLGISPEQELTPVPATRLDFRLFAADYGLSDRRADYAWRAVDWTHSRIEFSAHRRHPDVEAENLACYPPPRFLRDDAGADQKIVDLRSVYDRLRASNLALAAWTNSTYKTVEFLAMIVNEMVQPDPPLPLKGSLRPRQADR